MNYSLVNPDTEGILFLPVLKHYGGPKYDLLPHMFSRILYSGCEVHAGNPFHQWLKSNIPTNWWILFRIDRVIITQWSRDCYIRVTEGTISSMVSGVRTLGLYGSLVTLHLTFKEHQNLKPQTSNRAHSQFFTPVKIWMMRKCVSEMNNFDDNI